jgi:hypothetical protein
MQKFKTIQRKIDTTAKLVLQRQKMMMMIIIIIII